VHQFYSLSERVDTTTPGGKLVYHVFSAVAEFQRDLIRENTVHGLRAARERGVRLGRPPLMDEKTVQQAQRMRRDDDITVAEMANRLEVSRSTLARPLRNAVI
jgi:DNA invertase Pin-like site-specific DNA recombinase